MMAYRGDTPGKCKVRKEVYDLIERKRFRNDYHVVIASRHCGDIHFLLSSGVSKEKIIACDIDEDAKKAAAAFGVIVIDGAIDLVAFIACRRFPNRVASINIDLCNNVHNALPYLQRIIAEAEKYEKPPLIMLTYFIGRTDGFQNEQERKAFLLEQVSNASAEIRYYSSTSPMGVLTLQPKHKGSKTNGNGKKEANRKQWNAGGKEGMGNPPCKRKEKVRRR